MKQCVWNCNSAQRMLKREETIRQATPYLRNRFPSAATESIADSGHSHRSQDSIVTHAYIVISVTTEEKRWRWQHVPRRVTVLTQKMYDDEDPLATAFLFANQTLINITTLDWLIAACHMVANWQSTTCLVRLFMPDSRFPDWLLHKDIYIGVING